MEATKLGYQTWAIIVYMATTSPKGVSSMKIHRELGITQKTAWFLISRIREAYAANDPILSKEVETDETYVGGKEKNKPKGQRTGNRGTQGRTRVMGAKQRGGKVIARSLGQKETLADFVRETVEEGSTVYTDDTKRIKASKSTTTTSR